MSVYAPNYFPANQLSFTAGADITGGQVVYISAANTVSPTSAATIGWVGVAAHDAKSGTQVVVYTEGVHTVAASGSIAAGANVVGASSGAVADQSTPTAANDPQVIGLALTAAASNLVTILIR